MEFKQLEAFVQVAKQGSFSRAAEALYLTQPTISAHIASLESELETQLIVRAPRAAYPSEIGERFYEYAVKILAMRDEAAEICKFDGPIMRGTIGIAASTIPYLYVLPRLMAEFRELYPEIRFNLINGDSSMVVGQVLSGKVDVGMTGAVFESAACDYQAFMDDELVVITPNTPRYQALQRFDVEDLLRYPLITREAGSGTRKELENHLRDCGVRMEQLDIVAQMDDTDAIKNSVSQGLGIAVLSRLSVEDYEKFGRIRVFRLGGKPLVRQLYLVSHSKRPLSGIALAFMRFVQESSRADLASDGRKR